LAPDAFLAGDAMRRRFQFSLDRIFTATAWCAAAVFLVNDFVTESTLRGLLEMPAILACGAAALTSFFGRTDHSFLMATSVFAALSVGLGCFGAFLLFIQFSAYVAICG
jgi:hypothetical protein